MENQEVSFDELLELCRESTPGLPAIPAKPDISGFQEQLGRYFEKREKEKSVLGIDIYRYSRFELPRQRLIPFIFAYLYEKTVNDLREKEGLLFRESLETYEARFIPTGDGGFQILDTPLHAIAFALIFQFHLQFYNGYVDLPRVREFVGPLSIRWCVTHDPIYRFRKNHFGPAIINNARVLAKDTLNRFLVDSKVMEWFYRRVGNIESLARMDTADVHRSVGIDLKDSGSDILFNQGGDFSAIITQHIGELQAKDRSIDIYSVFIQRRIRVFAKGDENTKRPIVVSLGNTNAAGLASR